MKKRNGWWALFCVVMGALLGALLLPACSHSVEPGDSEQVGESRGAVAAGSVLQIFPPTTSIPATVRQQFEATLLAPGKRPSTLWSGVTWTVSAPKVASVSTTGLLTALAPGSATVTAAYSGLTASATVTVTSAKLVSVAVAPPASRIEVGTYAFFYAIGKFSDGRVFPLANAVTWASSNAAVATVGSTGLATGVASGAVSISATHTATGLTAKALLTVGSASLKSLAITPVAPAIPNGLAVAFAATGTFSDKSTQDLTNAVTWSSSSSAVATISNIASSAGVATTVGVGATTIKAAFGKATATTSLTVTAHTLVSIAVTPATNSIPNGTTASFLATGTYSDHTTQNITTAVTWTSSSSAVSVSNATGSNGLATAMALGSATVTATDSHTGISGTATLTVTAAILRSLSITPPTASLALGLPQQFLATGTYTDSTTKNVTSSVTWTSSASSVATVSNASGSAGLASTVGKGSTSVSATDPTTGVTASASLTVTSAVLVSIAIAPPSATIANGLTQQFTATATYSDGSQQNLTSVDAWSVPSGTAVVSNSGPNSGLATSNGVGTSTIEIADPSGISATATLNVTAATVVSVAVTPAQPSIPLGTTQAFTATATLTDGTTQNVTTAVTWSATNGDPISNVPGSNGTATGSVGGPSTITATYPPNVSGFTTLAVTAATLVSIAVTPSTASVAVGATQQFGATGTYTDGSTQDLTASVSWQSSAPTIFAVSGAAGSIGLGTALAAGTAIVTVTDPTTQDSGSATVTVTAPPGTASAVIGPAGGTVQLPGVGQVTIPAGALNASTTVTMAQVPAASIPNGGVTLTTAAVSLGPEGLSFPKPVVLTLFYDASLLPSGAQASAQAVYQVLSGSLVPDTTSALVTVNTTASSLSVPLNHFSTHVGGTAPASPVPIAITAGENHTCALNSDGTAFCWGDNAYGQLGNGTATAYASIEVPVSNLMNATAIAAGGFTTCALLSNQTVECWGDNTLGEVGNGTSNGSTPSIFTTPVAVSNLTGVVSIAGGNRQMCALLASGTVSCWGYNGVGALGIGSPTPVYSPVPVPVTGLSGATSIAGGPGGDYMCAVHGVNNYITCWGDNTYGQLGNTSIGTTISYAPVQNAFLYGVTLVAPGPEHACELGVDGLIECWGNNSTGQLGNGTTTSSIGPVEVSGLTHATALSSGNDFSCAVVAGGTAACWGYNSYGELGDGIAGPEICPGAVAAACSTTPSPVKGLTNAISIAAGAQHACALLATGAIQCWGDNSYAQLGNGEQGLGAGSTTPVTLAACTPGAAQCSGNAARTCGSNGQWGAVSAWCPAGCIAGQCATSPEISEGDGFACALLSGMGVECWGDNTFGELGNGSNTGPQMCSHGGGPTFPCSATPLSVPGTSGATAISASGEFACVLLASGSVECWGDNEFGELGTGGTGPETCLEGGCSTSPVPVSGISSAMAISVGSSSACALLSGGTVECWGDNAQGELGNGSATGPQTCGGRPCSTTPVLVSGLAGVTAISVGGGNACALLSGGTVECWGTNLVAQLGIGTNVGPQACDGGGPCSTTPVLVPGIIDATAISVTGLGACVLLASGAVECWGDNEYGELGIGTNAGPQMCPVPAVPSGLPCSTTPVFVTGLADVIAISRSEISACALLSGGAVECWGYNADGELGDGTSTGPQVCTVLGNSYPCSMTPVPVLGLNGAESISQGGANGCASLSGGVVECWGDNEVGELGIGTNTGPQTCGVAQEADPCSTTPVSVVW